MEVTKMIDFRYDAGKDPNNGFINSIRSFGDSFVSSSSQRKSDIYLYNLLSSSVRTASISVCSERLEGLYKVKDP